MMTLEKLLQDEALRRQEFPVTQDRIYLAHAGVCPLPFRVAQAIERYLKEATVNDQEAPVFPQKVDEARQLAAELIGAKPSEIALVGPTSLGLSFIASGLPWKTGDDVLIYFDDYPSNVYPWLALQDRGVNVRFLKTPGPGTITVDSVLSQVDASTRLVALASCHFISGYRLDHESLGRELRRRGIWFCLDAIQTLGAFPVQASACDFLSADAHKWLLGPSAAGILYVREELQDILRPTVFGWNNVRCPQFVAKDRLDYRLGAHRYEAGSYNWLGLVGMIESMRLIQELSVGAIAKELLRKHAILVEALLERGFEVLSPVKDDSHSSAIVSFRNPKESPTQLHARLLENKITTSLRTLRSGDSYIRFSPHFYNSDEELDRALSLL